MGAPDASFNSSNERRPLALLEHRVGPFGPGRRDPQVPVAWNFAGSVGKHRLRHFARLIFDHGLLAVRGVKR